MSDFSEDDDEVFVRYEGEKELSNHSESDGEIDVAAGRRWDPLGEEKEEIDSNIDHELRNESWVDGDNCHIKQLENEQEMLSTSLQALTSHFAQVQFRLRQICDAPADERDGLLKSLEEFAFRGIPEVMKLDPRQHEHLYKIMERQQSRQFELIEHLKRQLLDAEKFAYESGADILPQSVIVEKQKAFLNQLKNKLKLTVDDKILSQLTVDDIRAQVDNALGEFVQPMKMKDTLVSQLKTQIVDLERFVAYLQAEQEWTPEIKAAIKNSQNPEIGFQTYNSKMARSRKQSQSDNAKGTAGTSRNDYNGTEQREQSRVDHDLSGKMSSFLMKASNILDMFALTQLSCSSRRGQRRNSLKKTQKGNHWGDLRAKLEVDVQEIVSLVSSIEIIKKKTIAIVEESLSSDSEDETPHPKSQIIYDLHPADKEYIATAQAELTILIRKQFAITLQGLMQHGLRDGSRTSNSLVPFIGCMMPFSQQTSAQRRMENYDEATPTEQMHVWELILEYYHIKNGDQFNDTPARKLSESFNLDIMGTGSMPLSSNKHTMLTAIGSIIATHAPYKRSYNSHFKAFISAALNSRKLTQWLGLIFQCTEVMEQYYTDWSYVAHTGFRDALRCIDRLSQHQFELPVDLAIRQFQNIKDVFM